MEYAWSQEDMAAPEPPIWPKKIFVEITSHCNMACRFCPSPMLDRRRRDIDPDIMRKILKELKGKDILLAFHVLGEPLLNKSFFEYARLCDNYGIKYWLVSNGLLFTEENVRKIFSLENLQNLEVSFHTCDAASWTLRGCAKSFEDYLRKIRLPIFSPERYEREIPLNIDVMYDLHLGQWGWNAFDKSAWRGFAATLLEWREELMRKFPDVQERYSRFFNGKKKKFQRDNLVWWRNFEDIPENLFQDFPASQMWLAWEFFPKIFVTFKKFFFFGKDEKYIRHALGKEHGFEIRPAKNFSCSWNQDLAILSDGTITFCCLDYEGKLACGNIADMSLEEACASAIRQKLLQSPEAFNFCRDCRGHLERKPKAENES